MFCPQCRTANQDSARWCTACGAALSPTSVPPSPAVAVLETAQRTCTRCGAANVTEARWCGACGQSLLGPGPLARPRRHASGLKVALGFALGMVGVIVAFVVLGVVIYLVEGPTNDFNADFGHSVAQSSLPLPEDLPGTNWKIEKKNDFDESRIDSDAGACLATQQRFDEVTALLARTRTGRASTELQRPSGDPNIPPTSLLVQVSVHRKQDGLQDAIDRDRKGWSSPDARTCIEYVMKGSRLADVAPSMAPPEGGAAYAYILTLTEGDKTVQIRNEMYMWRRSNAVVRVLATGPSSEVNATLLSAAIRRAGERLGGESRNPGTASPSAGTSATPSATPAR